MYLARAEEQSAVRSPELPPSFRGPGEERGASGETGSPRPGCKLDCWHRERPSARGWPRLHAVKVSATDVRPGNELADRGVCYDDDEFREVFQPLSPKFHKNYWNYFT